MPFRGVARRSPRTTTHLGHTEGHLVVTTPHKNPGPTPGSPSQEDQRDCQHHHREGPVDGHPQGARRDPRLRPRLRLRDPHLERRVHGGDGQPGQRVLHRLHRPDWSDDPPLRLARGRSSTLPACTRARTVTGCIDITFVDTSGTLTTADLEAVELEVTSPAAIWPATSTSPSGSTARRGMLPDADGDLAGSDPVPRPAGPRTGTAAGFHFTWTLDESRAGTPRMVSR
jgi:hypothetical protein